MCHPTDPEAFDPIKTFKATNSVSINLWNYMESTMSNRYVRMRITSIHVILKRQNGTVILSRHSNKGKVRFEIKLPTEFTDVDANRNQHKFVAYGYKCYAGYRKANPTCKLPFWYSEHIFYPIHLIFSNWIDEAQTIKTQPCTVQSEYARSLNGTYTITLIDFQIDNEEIFHLDFRIKGIKEDLQSRNVFRHKKFIISNWNLFYDSFV